jgi:tetrahydromethanopterin S-methyltransferase subunit E
MRSYKELSYKLLEYLIDSHKNCRKTMYFMIFQLMCIGIVVVANWGIIGDIYESLPWAIIGIVISTIILAITVIVEQTHRIRILKKGFEKNESKKKS